MRKKTIYPKQLNLTRTHPALKEALHLDMVVDPTIPALAGLRQNNPEFKASLSYIGRSYLKQ